MVASEKVEFMSYLIFIPIAFGICCGAFLGYWSSKPLALRLSKSSDAPRLVLWCSATGALLIALPAFSLSFIIGGNLGGALGEAASFSTGLVPVAVPFGLAIGITVVFGGGLAVGIVVGALFGMLIAYALRKFAPTNHSGETL